ncbi:hypothetical protein HRH25_14485 [Flavisolibacter sp. BT320]|nr:hypothetical protein [Flavisolibacter longurius]
MKRGLLFLPILAALMFFIGNNVSSQTLVNNKVLWTADSSPDGKYIAVGGNIDSLNIYLSDSLQLFASFPIHNTITSIKWHPDKNLLAFATQTSKNKVSILDFDAGNIIELEGVSPEGARGIDWNFTGEFLAVGDNDGQIAIFGVDGRLVRKIQHNNTKSITSIDWHPKKNIFITVGDKIRVFDISGSLLKTIIHRNEEALLLCVAWHKSGKFFVTGDYGDNIFKHKPLLQFWNLKGELIKSINISKGEYRNIRWNPQGDRLASASDALRIWDKNGILLHEGGSKDFLWGISWNMNGSRIVTSSKEQDIVIWDNMARLVSAKQK